MIENCFLLYVVNSRLKKFFCCLLQGIILSSQITIYTSHCTFLLLQYVNDLCRRSEYLRIDSFVSLRELPLAKILSQISQESNASEAALSKSDCKSNTFLLHHQTFYKLFLGKNIPHTTNTMIYTRLGICFFCPMVSNSR